MPIIKKCQCCGRNFKVPPSHAKWGKFCSLKCRFHRILRVCRVCGKAFHIRPSEIKKGYGQYCSQQCSHKPRTTRMEKHCEVCGKTFYVTPSKARNGKGRFCSRGCANSVIHSSLETRLKISNCMKEAWQDSDYRDKILGILKQHSPIWNRSPDSQRKILRALMKRPTSLERKLISMIKSWNLPFRYCGDGDVILGGHCPDFINYNGKKQVIEVFGRYWHDKNINPKIPWSQTAEGKIDHYKKYGFSCLIIWDRELNDESAVVKKIEAFEEEAGHA